MPRRVRAALAAAVIASTAVLAGGRTGARAQSDDSPTPTVSPKDLGKHLADPNKPSPKTKAQPETAGTYVVKEGDCLWTIAAAHLEGRATNRAVTGEVDRIYRVNAETIGTGNPNLIYPGQRLKLD